MDYSRIYQNLIDNAKNRNLSNDVYFEKHHILPKCLGGNDDENNLVKLTAKEHFIAHKLLYKIHLESKSIRWAYCMMVMTTLDSMKKYEKVTTKRYYRVSGKDYEECRNWVSKESSEFFKGKIYVNNGEIQTIINPGELGEFLINGWKKGKLPFSEEALMSIKEHAKNRILSEETHIKKSNSVSGSKNPAFGTKMMNKDGLNKRVEVNEVDKYLKNGWKLGMLRVTNIKELTKNCKKDATAGRFIVHTETEPFLVRYARKEEFDYYINVLKWFPGSGKHRNECKDYIRNFGIQKTWVYKLDPYEKRRIPDELKDFYLENGWMLGQGNFFKNKQY